MHSTIFSAFDRLCHLHQPGARVLEVGAMASPDTLLNLPALSGVGERVGINIDRQPDFGGFRIIAGNANAMTMFETESFDLVLCNSVLEHDAHFWLSLGEIRRVLRRGGIAMLGVPGYGVARGAGKRLASAASRLWSPNLPGGSMLAERAASTPTLNVHNFPADYYRFSAQAMRDVFLEDLDVLAIEELMTPPRIIGVGRKP